MFKRKIHFEHYRYEVRSLCNYPILDNYLTNNKRKVTCGNCKRILKSSKTKKYKKYDGKRFKKIKENV